MMRFAAMTALGLMLAACGSGGTESGAADPAANESANATAAVDEQNQPKLAACPFRETRDWQGSVTGGRVLVNGKVDLQMAGFEPALTPRAGGSGGTLVLDLTLAPKANGLSDSARYEAAGRYSRAEIHCGGERIAEINIVQVVS
jgi:hypothetical protein